MDSCPDSGVHRPDYLGPITWYSILFYLSALFGYLALTMKRDICPPDRSLLCFSYFLSKNQFLLQTPYVPGTNTYNSGMALTIVYDNFSLYMSVHTVNFPNAGRLHSFVSSNTWHAVWPRVSKQSRHVW